MRSLKPKVMHEVCGATLVECVLDAVLGAGVSRVIVVVGDKKELIVPTLRGKPVEIAEQCEQLGTAHAVMAARRFLPEVKGHVLILNGDAPLVKPQTLKRLVALHAETDADVTLVTAQLDNPYGYGRISRDARGSIGGIVEQGEAAEDELNIREINAGIYVFKTTSLFEGLDAIVPHNKKGEFYLTDIISIFYNNGKKIEGFVSENSAEILGINTQQELAIVNQIRRDEILQSFMNQGIAIVNPSNTFIENHVVIGEGTTIYPFTYICKHVVIGKHCSIGPFAYIKADTKIGDDVEMRNSVNEEGRVFLK